ncbi:MAG: universal stress protein [Halodesulfurarchaeum sp.]
MIDRVLVPMDESEMAEEALRYALEVHRDAEITVLHVVGEPSPMMGKAVGLALEDDVEGAGEKDAFPVLEKARKLADDCDVQIETDVGYGSPAKVIVERADVFDAIVIGRHSSSLIERLLLGNVAERVAEGASISVTIVR